MKLKRLTFLVLVIATFSGKNIIASIKTTEIVENKFIKFYLSPAKKLFANMKTISKNYDNKWQNNETKMILLLTKSNFWIKINKNKINKNIYKKLIKNLDQLTENFEAKKVSYKFYNINNKLKFIKKYSETLAGDNIIECAITEISEQIETNKNLLGKKIYNSLISQVEKQKTF